MKAARRLLKLVHYVDFHELALRAPEFCIEPEVQARVAAAVAGVERLLPPPPGLPAMLAALEADSLLLVSRCTLGGFDLDVLKAAREIGLPTTMLVWSWDNLSSKAVLSEHPDRLIVWNETAGRRGDRAARDPGGTRAGGRRRELRRVLRGGTAGRARAARQRSSPPGLPRLVVERRPREPEVFARWLAAVRASGDPALRDATVDVRPHPGSHAWDEWTPPDERCRLRRAPAKADVRELAALLAHADAAVALNTSAEIEAAITGVPVLTFRAGEGAAGQEGSLHFTYLLEENGGFVIDAQTLEEHVEKLAAVVRGDHDPSAIRAFVERFARPGGLDLPVGPQVAAIVLEQAGTAAAVTV